MTQTPEVVRTRAELIRWNSTTVDAIGRYEAMPRPVRGTESITLPHDRAAIVLSDGAKVYLEALDSQRSVRAPDEIARFAGKLVCVRGIAREVMPAQGESLLAPCISDVEAIAEV
jgi:hypothetical protein